MTFSRHEVPVDAALGVRVRVEKDKVWIPAFAGKTSKEFEFETTRLDSSELSR